MPDGRAPRRWHRSLPRTRATVSPTPTRIDLHHLVRKSRATDLVAMGSVLAAAFHDDPVLTWMVPDEPRRRASLPGLMRLLAARFQPHGENHINDTGTGAAVWSPPRHLQPGRRRVVRVRVGRPRRRRPRPHRRGGRAAREQPPPRPALLPEPAGRHARPPGHRHRLRPAAGGARPGRPRGRLGLPRSHVTEQPGAVRAPRVRGVAGAALLGLPAAVGDVAPAPGPPDLRVRPLAAGARP